MSMVPTGSPPHSMSHRMATGSRAGLHADNDNDDDWGPWKAGPSAEQEHPKQVPTAEQEQIPTAEPELPEQEEGHTDDTADPELFNDIVCLRCQDTRCSLKSACIQTILAWNIAQIKTSLKTMHSMLLSTTGDKAILRNRVLTIEHGITMASLREVPLGECKD